MVSGPAARPPASEVVRGATSTDAAGTASTYTSAFGQTSGASAIVAGAALLLQSWRKFVHGAPFSVPRLRALLSHTAVNTPSKDRVKDLIGYMPNLNAIRNHVETDDDSSIAQTLTEMAKRATRRATAKKLAKAARRILKDAGKRSKHER